jgi:acetyltransferase-like isoleucine patch superfamily enzyme
MNLDPRLKKQLPNWERILVHDSAEIRVKNLRIGSGTVIGAGVIIEGHSVTIGREAWLDRYAYIGGGSAFDPVSDLVVGDWLHMGRQSHINAARSLKIGHEFGCGVETKVFTHGAYLPETEGFPVSFAGGNIGDRVWLPNAWVNPGIAIGNDVVVAARSLINRDLPSGCLAGGIPVKILKENVYPSQLSATERAIILERIVAETQCNLQRRANITIDSEATAIQCDETILKVVQREIHGPCSESSCVLKNQLRRHGIRFRYEERDGYWQPWSTP